MAKITAISLGEARQLTAAYGLELVHFEALEQGSVNSNFRFTTSDNRQFFARLYEEQGVAGASRELMLLAELSAAGVPTAVPLRPLAAEIPVFLGKPFAVYPFIEGESLCQARTGVAELQQLGANVGLLHSAAPRLSPPGKGRFEPENLLKRLDKIETELAGSESPLLRATAFIRNKLNFYAARRVASAPQGVIHGDLFRDNVIWHSGKIKALIDFESASTGFFAFDLMVCIEAWCFRESFDLELARAFLQGYVSRRPLAAIEVDALPIEGALVALRFATTRITDFSLRTPSWQQPKRDYRRFLSRLEQIEAGALSSVFAEFRS